jgi:hypothetical protein
MFGLQRYRNFRKLQNKYEGSVIKIVIFVNCNDEDMDQINIYSEGKVISRIITDVASCHQEGHAGDIDNLLDCLAPYEHVYAVMDLQVVKKCRFALDLGVALQERNIPMRSIEASEKDKTLETVMEICSWLLEKGADRDALVLAVGGGITTDMVGFAASIQEGSALCVCAYDPPFAGGCGHRWQDRRELREIQEYSRCHPSA